MSNTNQNRVYMPRMVLHLFTLLLLVSGLSACIPKPQQNADKLSSVRTYGDGFPVVKPFDLTKAGTTVTAEFELPDSSYKGHYQPVFVGFRSNTAIGAINKELWEKVEDYLSGPIPIKVQLWRLEHGKYVPVVLHKRYRVSNERPAKYQYKPHPNPIFTHHSNTNMNYETLVELGKYDYNRVYDPDQIARIDPARPGRYRIQMQNMQAHPILAPMHIEMIVGHHRIWIPPQ